MLHDYETNNAAIAYSFAPDENRRVKQVRLHMSATGGAAENLTITHNSALGSAYDLLLETQAMAAVQDYVWNPTNGSHYLSKGDSLDIAYNNGNSRTYGLEVLYE